MASYYLLENGTDRLLMEDGSLFLTEDSAATIERDATITASGNSTWNVASFILRDATLANSITASGSGAAIFGSVGTVEASATLAIEGASVIAADFSAAVGIEATATAAKVISSDATISAQASVAADGEIVETATVIESDFAISGACDVTGEGEDIAVPVAPPQASGGIIATRRPFFRREEPKPKPQPKPKARIVASDFEIEATATFKPRYARLRVIQPAAPPVVIKPIPPPPVNVAIPATLSPLKRRDEQSRPIPLRPQPRQKPQWVDFEEEMVLCLLVA